VLRDAILRTVCPGPAVIPVLVMLLMVSPLLGLLSERPQQHVQPVLELVRGRRQLEASGPDGDDPEPQMLRRGRVAVQAVEHGPDVVVAQPLECCHLLCETSTGKRFLPPTLQRTLGQAQPPPGKER
jgi:hypothetical protein